MQSKPSSQTIRALDRGLSVLEHLAQRGQMSLADLRKATGLANPTLLRLMATLQSRGWVHRNIVEGFYELSHSLGAILGASNRAHPLAEIAGPTLIALSTDLPDLPSDLCAVMGPGRLEIVESTRRRGPMAPTRTSFGIRPSMVLSAHGRVTLAHAGKADYDRHIEAILATGSKEDILWIESGRLKAEVDLTRDRGYGLREPDYWQAPFDPGPELGAVALPVRSRSGLHGSVSLLWMTQEMDLDDLLALGAIDTLRQAADEIAAAMQTYGIPAPDVTRAQDPFSAAARRMV